MGYMGLRIGNKFNRLSNALLRVAIKDGKFSFEKIIRVIYWIIRMHIHRLFQDESVSSAYGLKLAPNYNDTTFKMYVTAAYDYVYWNRLKKINEPFSFIDVGANQGLYAIRANSNPFLINAYAFEPINETFTLLKKNIELNCAEKCVPIKKAISSLSGKTEIFLEKNHSGASSLSPCNPLSQGDPITETVPVIDYAELDQYVRHSDCPIYVKVDVEGHEMVVIEQFLKSSFSARIVEFFFEVDEEWIDISSVKTILQTHGFSEFEVMVGTRNVHYDCFARKKAFKVGSPS